MHACLPACLRTSCETRRVTPRLFSVRSLVASSQVGPPATSVPPQAQARRNFKLVAARPQSKQAQTGPSINAGREEAAQVCAVAVRPN